jgi:metallophosphoesterase (TIGR00282 family)
MLKILFFGDIFGKMGREGIKKILPKLQKDYQPDFIFANAENLAHGRGVTTKTMAEMTDLGLDGFTSGNHVWDKADGDTILNKKDSVLLRPANYPEGTAGLGQKIFKIGLKNLLVLNLIGQVFFKEEYANPFLAADKILAGYKHERLDGIIVDFHAEATSEKRAMGFYLDSRVSAVLGTHTHIQTADQQILPAGTAYISDIGMTGPLDSVIGLDKKDIIHNFVTQNNKSASVPETGPCLINAVFLEIDNKTQLAKKIDRIYTEVKI